ncbi:A/G-specific adenine glycosylase [Aquibium sp. ELW1220]|uniref:A/G-specific adenine glycosylase n=1 Tax=Aquibium sp. ELW1220 TaxID=2976766 RepID=UPI0025B18C4E|nr:A/G-specific adenine glycosylase [Aquibium sp. ELW1220]MDN2582758.1 A/G-specific adenine glycosylase [Aquibium sp. ELW1220]
MNARTIRTNARPPISAPLLAWYDRHHRRLPWRIGPADARAGRRADPYRVWLSEIMLQQTTVQAVKPYFEAFTERWPTVEALAAAPADDIMKAWAGLGYYSRARNLKKCAETVAQAHGGRFPDDVEGLKALPGIGDYTAAAIAAIAFARPAAVVDGNVERVMTRLAAIPTPLPAAKPAIRAMVQDLLPASRPGDFAQATMDLGATICTPKRPACPLCPISEGCAAFRAGTQDEFPVKAPKAVKPVRQGAAFVAENRHGAVLLRKRAEKGLLGGMSEPPTSAWTARVDGAAGTGAAPFAADWRAAGTVTHVFTHFELRLTVYHARADFEAPAGAWWSARADLAGEALPTVMKKAIETAIPGATRKPAAAGRPNRHKE